VVDNDPRAERNRLLILGVVGLVVAGGLLALFVGLVAGTDGRVFSDASQPATRTGQDRTSDPLTAITPTPTTPTPSPTATRTQSPRQPRPTLTASPLEAQTYDRIDLTGQFPGLLPGAALQIERRQDGEWVVFPVPLSAQPDGSFATYVQTGRVGENVFRVTDTTSGRSTPPVTVQIG
jgi:hypothetical protein